MTVSTDREALEVAVNQLLFQINAYETYLYTKSDDMDQMLAMSAIVTELKATVETLKESL